MRVQNRMEYVECFLTCSFLSFTKLGLIVSFLIQLIEIDSWQPHQTWNQKDKPVRTYVIRQPWSLHFHHRILIITNKNKLRMLKVLNSKVNTHWNFVVRPIVAKYNFWSQTLNFTFLTGQYNAVDCKFNPPLMRSWDCELLMYRVNTK